jgi:hypothetical protein
VLMVAPVTGPMTKLVGVVTFSGPG